MQPSNDGAAGMKSSLARSIWESPTCARRTDSDLQSLVILSVTLLHFHEVHKSSSMPVAWESAAPRKPAVVVQVWKCCFLDKANSGLNRWVSSSHAGLKQLAINSHSCIGSYFCLEACAMLSRPFWTPVTSFMVCRCLSTLAWFAHGRMFP